MDHWTGLNEPMMGAATVSRGEVFYRLAEARILQRLALVEVLSRGAHLNFLAQDVR